MRYLMMSLVAAAVALIPATAHADHCEDQFVYVMIPECPRAIAPAGSHACVGAGGPGGTAAWFCTPGP